MARYFFVEYRSESLYQAWKESGLTLSQFVERNKSLIDQLIKETK